MAAQSRFPATVQIVWPQSFLNAKNAKVFQEQIEMIADSGIHTVIVDCREVDYISSAGIRMFEKLTKLLETTHGGLILCNLEDYIEELFEISGFDQVFLIKHSLNEIEVWC